MGPGGALEAALEARAQGLIRFIGVTGHGLAIPSMHLRSLQRFAFDSVLLPYNYMMMQNPQYAADFEALLQICQARQVAAAVPGARLEVIEGAGHGVHLEAPMTFARLAASFLKG